MKGCRLLKSPVSLRRGKRASQLHKSFPRALHSMGKPQKAHPRYESPIPAARLRSSTTTQLSRPTGAAELLVRQEAVSARGSSADYTYNLSAHVDKNARARWASRRPTGPPHASVSGAESSEKAQSVVQSEPKQV